VPLADALMLATLRSSITTIAWFLLMVLETLCR
jgi:hypothetical protein